MRTRMARGRLGRRQFLAGAAGLGATAAGLAVWASGTPLSGRARSEPPLIGWLAPGAEAEDLGQTPFRDGLREQGLIEGENLRIAWRYAEGRPERLPGLVAELLEMRVAVLVAGGNTQAARRATDRVPIVSINRADPVAQGFAASLARPGGNLTGVGGTRAEALYQKAAELLADVVPDARRLAYLGNLTGSGTGSPHEAVAEVAAQRGLQVLIEDVPSQTEVEMVSSGRASGALTCWLHRTSFP